MKSKIIALALAAATGISASTYAQNNDPEMLRKLYDEALVNGQCYKNLRYLCKTIGPRLSGSTGAARSVEWGKKLIDRKSVV